VTAVRVGIVILPDQRWSVARERWQRAEEYGFDHAFTYDHLGWRNLVDGPWFDAVPTLAAAAQVTSRIRLGTLVASANFRHPVHFAREVTALDDVSGGRLLLGLGAGGGGFDEAVLGDRPLTVRARVDRFAEFLELLDTLLTTGEPVTWSGRYYSAVDARSLPGCVQTPRVPFVVAANGPRSMALVARYGQGWITAGSAEDLDAWWAMVATATARFGDALAAAGREPSSVDRYLSLDAAPVFSLASVEAFADAVGRAGELGFTDVITHWPRQEGWYAGAEATLESVAADILPRLRTPA
jgi:alkanesulfonate monooxygenase SsuD/methylene tetrahydromethanopterin reductase-like flavin-dependent oxidoreductase (luciferase family)